MQILGLPTFADETDAYLPDQRSIDGSMSDAVAHLLMAFPQNRSLSRRYRLPFPIKSQFIQRGYAIIAFSGCFVAKRNGELDRKLHSAQGAVGPCSIGARRNSSDPIAWPGSLASGSVGRIGKIASIDRKTPTSDAFCESRSEPLELRNPLIDPFHPLARKMRPVSPRGDTISRKLGKFLADLVEREAEPLREDDERDPAKHRTGIAAMT